MNDDVLPIQIRRGKVLGLEVHRTGAWCYVGTTSSLASDVCGWRRNLLVEPLVIVGSNKGLAELGQIGVKQATSGVLGSLLPMQDSAKVNLNLVFGLKCERDGQLYAGAQSLVWSSCA